MNNGGTTPGAGRAFDVTVVGELNLDLILYGLPDELAPERELLASSMALTLGSSSAIFAHNLAVLGRRVGFISRIGTDQLGALSLARLAAGGVDVSRVRKVEGPVTTGLGVILPGSVARRILTYPGTMFEMCYEDLDLEYLASARHFHLSSFFLHRALQPRIAGLFCEMRKRGLTTSLDTNDDPDDRWGSGLPDVLPYVDVLFLNDREVRKVAANESLEAAADKVAGLVSTLVVKLGAQGALLRHQGKELRSAAVPVEVVDPVGAGDTFDAGFIHQFLRGSDLATCLRFANIDAAFSTTRPGGTEAFLDGNQLKTFFAEHWHIEENQ
jgi:sugar/nucleoside kinase (ribokinase family)